MELKETGFIRGDDNRLIKLDDGSWGLQEWLSSNIVEEDVIQNKYNIFNSDNLFMQWLLYAAIGFLLLLIIFKMMD